MAIYYCKNTILYPTSNRTLQRRPEMGKKTLCQGLLSLAVLACTDGEITQPTGVSNAPIAEISSSSIDSFIEFASSSSVESSYSSIEQDFSSSSGPNFSQTSSSSEEYSSSSFIGTFSSSAKASTLCKVSGNWGNYGGCVIIHSHGDGDLWSSGDLKVKTNAYAEDSSQFGNRAGEFFFETDSIEGGNTQISWSDLNNPIVRAPEFQGYLDINVQFDKGKLDSDPYFNIVFYVAGFDSDGVALSADISNWNGLCILYSGTIGSVLQLDLGDSINQELNYVLPSVAISKYGKPQCYEWKDFVQPETEKVYKAISGDEAAKHVERIIFHFQTQPNIEFDGYEGIEIIAIGTNRDE